MEWVWYIIAALGAGVGTGLAGLSAATVMVPILSFWPQLSSVPLIAQTLSCLGGLILYIVPCVMVLLPVRFLTKVPSYVFRKLLHIVAFTCLAVMTLGAQSWQAAALSSIVIACALYPLLSVAEHESWYGTIFVQKSSGEVRRSLLMLFLMFATVIAVSWGIFGSPQVAAASILMWGMGDAYAALVGIPCGRHKIRTPYAVKSWEGTVAMFAAVFLSGAVVLHFFGGYDVGHALVAALLAGAVGAATELFSASEWDTVTVPVAILIVLLVEWAW